MQRVGKACYTSSLSKAKAYLKLSLEEKTKINLFSVYLPPQLPVPFERLELQLHKRHLHVCSPQISLLRFLL